jgi:hypothetical protein
MGSAVTPLPSSEILLLRTMCGSRTGGCVANMATYAISSSLILVIHDNMINETILFSMSL